MHPDWKPCPHHVGLEGVRTPGSWSRALSENVTLVVATTKAYMYHLEFSEEGYLRKQESYYLSYNSLDELDQWLAENAGPDGRPLTGAGP